LLPARRRARTRPSPLRGSTRRGPGLREPCAEGARSGPCGRVPSRARQDVALPSRGGGGRRLHVQMYEHAPGLQRNSVASSRASVRADGSGAGLRVAGACLAWCSPSGENSPVSSGVRLARATRHVEAWPGLREPCTEERGRAVPFNETEHEAHVLVRKGGLEPPRCYPLAPQARAPADSATFTLAEFLTDLPSGG